MKKLFLKTLTKKHKRCSQGLGVFKAELLEGNNPEEVNKALKELDKEGSIELIETTAFGTLCKLTKKYKKANKLWVR